jgi:hypothetical protein
MLRSKSRYTPEFKGPVEGWVVNQLTKGKLAYWRVERTLSRDEVLQEAYECFLRCCKRFPKSADYDTPQAFMALYKRAWHNQFTDLATYDTADRQCLSVDAREIKLEDPAGALENDGYLSIMIQEAPQEVATVLSLFLNAPSELLDLAMQAWRIGGRHSPGSSRHLCRLLGMDDSCDPVKMVEDYFAPTRV